MALAPLVGTIVRGQPITPVQSHDLAQRFSLGQTLKGTVLRALPEGQTLVNFGGQHVLLDLGHALVKGQTFLATVTQITPTLMLKMLDEGHEVTPPATTMVAPHTTPSGARNAATPLTLDAAQLKPYVVAKQPFGDMISTLQQHLAPHPLLHEVDAILQQRLTATLAALMPDTAQAPDAAMLQEQVDKSGLNYEAKVADFLSKQAAATDREVLTQDLKGQLLELLSRLEQHATSHADAPDLRRQVQQALQTIEFQQLANLFAHQEHQSLLLQFMHPAWPASHTAQVYFRVNPQDDSPYTDAPRSYTLVFLLDLSSLGPIRVDATVRPAHITASISTTTAAVAEFISGHTPALSARLQELGFHTDVHCRAQADLPLAVEDTFSRLLMAAPSHLLDITT